MKERQSSLAKKTAISLAALGGLGLLAKHKDILPAVLTKGPSRKQAGGSTLGTSLRALKTLAEIKRLHLGNTKATNSLKHLVDQETLASDDYQKSTAGVAERLARLPEAHPLKQDALHVGGALLGAGLSKRKASKKAKLLGAASLLTLGAKHNEKLTSNALKNLKRAKKKHEVVSKYVKTLPAARASDYFRDRHEVMKERNPPPENTGVQPMDTSGGCLACGSPPRGRGWGDKPKGRAAAKALPTPAKTTPTPTPTPAPAAPSEPAKKGKTWKEKLKTAAKYAIPAAAALAATAYAYKKGKIPGLIKLKGAPHVPVTKRLGDAAHTAATKAAKAPANAASFAAPVAIPAALQSIAGDSGTPASVASRVVDAAKKTGPLKRGDFATDQDFVNWANDFWNTHGKHPKAFIKWFESLSPAQQDTLKL